MKKLFILFGIAVFCFTLSSSVFAQTEIKGSGNTAATNTLETKNSTPVTTMVVRDDGNVGIGTTSPNSKLEVNGLIHSTTGGVKFPDNTVQVSAASGGVNYQFVVTVAKVGGDFNTITGALSSLPPTPPPYGPGSAWHIRVMPGVYNESFTLLPYIHLKGAGKHNTFIQGTVTLSDTCLIEDFHIRGGILCSGTSPTILHNIITTGGDNSHGIYITSGGNPWIKENEVIDCVNWGIFVQDFGTDPWIIANKILRNGGGGIRCENSSPTISNNFIFQNSMTGIFLVGANGTPAEPTIDDNVIGSTSEQLGGRGIYMTGYAEPRIIANDIYLCEYAIVVDGNTQPSIIGNNLNYNFENGIWCTSPGATKPVVIKSNHIHSNGDPGAVMPAGILLQGEIAPIISHNNIHNNYHDPAIPIGADIDYFNCPGMISIPMISLNVYDNILRSGAGTVAGGNYNVDSFGNPINP